MTHAPPYPVFLNVTQQPVLIVGGGAVGLRKARGLVECAARVTVVSIKFAPGLDALPDIERIQGPYAATHMARKMWRLVFAATDDGAVNGLVQKHAEAAGILCCRCDAPEEGDFAGGATARIGATKRSDGRGVRGAAKLGGVTLVVGTTGASPQLAARICRQAAEAVDPVLPMLADLLSGWRAQAKEKIKDAAVRGALLRRAAGEEMEAAIRSGGAASAGALFAQWLTAARRGDAEFLRAGAPGGNGDGASDDAD